MYQYHIQPEIDTDIKYFTTPLDYKTHRKIFKMYK